MSNLTQQQKQNALAIKQTLSNPSVMKRIEEMIGRKSDSYITSVMQVINSNGLLAQSTPESVIGAVYTACALNLPLNNNLGFAYIVPFKNRQSGNQEAQFQMGWKGYLQLAQRSGQIKKIASIAVYDTDTEESVKARLTSFIPQKVSGEVIGYLAYLETVTGFEAHLTMTNEELEQHASKYSQTYKTAKSRGQNYSVWHQNWDAMCQKTVIKLLISKYAPMSVELQQAIEFDQAVINEDGEASYVDNDQEGEKPLARLISEDQFPQFVAAIEAGSLTKEHALNPDIYALSEEQKKIVEAL